MIFQARTEGNLLIIPAKQEQNDYMEFDIIKGKLHFRIRPTIWDENGNIVPPESNFFVRRIYKRVN